MGIGAADRRGPVPPLADASTGGKILSYIARGLHELGGSLALRLSRADRRCATTGLPGGPCSCQSDHVRHSRSVLAVERASAQRVAVRSSISGRGISSPIRTNVATKLSQLAAGSRRQEP